MDLSQNPKEAIRQAIEAKKAPRIAKIQTLLAQIDKLKSEIEAQKQELKSELIETFDELQKAIDTLPEPQRSEAQQILDSYKLSSLEFLGILTETTESAIINALERGEDIQETITEITKDLAHQTIDINVDATHIRDISKTILSIAATIAEASVNYADEILEGAILGVKQGIHKSLVKFDETIRFTPDEARALIIENYDSILQDLPHIHEIYMQTIQEVAQQSELGIQEKILSIAQKNASLFERLKTEAEKAIGSFKKRFEELLSEGTQVKLGTEEAKRLGLQAFNKAKQSLQNAIKGAKDAMGK